MALSKDVYKEFEDVVGAENISDDPAIKDAYRSPDLTVILPGSTEEVAAVIKLCNKHKIPYKAQSTGWMLFAPTYDFIFMDLRRMNRIIEINEKNMYAVVEPYVISAELMAELFKRGMICNVKGSGSTCTALAMSGHGHMGMTTSTGDRNDLATEWVTDEGEIVRLGTLGASDEWFCGDGPGPSLRGVYRGGGVITRQATKVYHWPGPSEYPLEGLSPRYTLSKKPSEMNMMVRYFSFPSIGKLIEAELKIGESEIAFELMGFCPSMVSSNITTSNEEDFETLEQFTREVQGPGFMVIIVGNFDEDFAYKKKVLAQIIKETDGESLKAVEDPDAEATLLFQCTRVCASIRETFRAGGMFSSMMVQGQRYDNHVRWLEEAAVLKRELIEKGLVIADDGQQFGWGEEGGHLGHTEIFCRYNPYDEKSSKAVQEWLAKVGKRALDGCFAVPSMGILPVDVIGKRASNYHIWFGKLKEAFDPNGVGENTGFSYVGADTSGVHTSIYQKPEKASPKK
ncbi:MAG TPA: FAD-dependent oxidoreductase [Dehalococcoidia bacterium]|nr:FAD-dependent oxidoreductase [Dehalococcoidia bacterium]